MILRPEIKIMFSKQKGKIDAAGEWTIFQGFA